jgi:hypothetical protein
METTKTAKKRMGRPPTGVGEPVTVRLQPVTIEALDAWRRNQPNPPTRPEAIRRLLGQTLMWRGVSAVELWDASMSVLKYDPESPAYKAAVDLIAARNPGISGEDLVKHSHSIIEEAVGHKIGPTGHPKESKDG